VCTVDNGTIRARVGNRLAALAPRPLFSVGGVAYCWDDVLAWAEARGSLGELQTTSRRGLACLRRAASLDDGVDQEALSAAATRFRYDHRLLSGEELAAWFARWEITVDEWGAYLERSLLLERWAEKLDAIEAESSSGPALEDAEFVDAVCSGFLEREALAFATDRAMAGQPEAVSDGAVAREFTTRQLDWTRLELDLLELADEGAAREAALCVRVDGRALADVAAECDVTLRRMSVYVADVDPGLLPPLLAAQPGELVGPVDHHGVFALLAIHERTPPAPTDPELRRRAESALHERAVRRAMDGRVEWHEHV